MNPLRKIHALKTRKEHIKVTVIPTKMLKNVTKEKTEKVKFSIIMTNVYLCTKYIGIYLKIIFLFLVVRNIFVPLSRPM